MNGQIVTVYIGKREKYNGEITVREPDGQGDIELSIRDAGCDTFTIFFRPSDARRLAQALLHVSEED